MKPIFESAVVPSLSPAELDARLSTGWRHFGADFFRTNIASHAGVFCGILPLRIRVANFRPSKSQRRVLRRNADAWTSTVPTRHCAEYDALFDIHRSRFTDDIPNSLHDFLSDAPASRPCENVAVEVRVGGRLVAVSFMDVGGTSTSSVYAMFDPEHEGRSPGIFTLLVETEESRRLDKEFLYLGYAYTVPSVYDYKKRFGAVETFDWERGWVPLPPDFIWFRRREDR